MSSYNYGHPPPESVSGINAGECKEGQKPCYNRECERCRKDYLRQQRFVFNAQLFENDKLYDELFDELYDGGDGGDGGDALAISNAANPNAANPNAANPNDAHNISAGNDGPHIEILPA